jgi:hypothetical protein
MSNIDLFHHFTAKTFAILYDDFPMLKSIAAEELVQGVDLGDVGVDHAREVAGHTLLWLFETGYVHRKGQNAPFRFTLSPKGFEVLDASPFPSQEFNQPAIPAVRETMGERLVALTKDTLTSEGKEQLKSLVHAAFGWGMTYIAAKTSGMLP